MDISERKLIEERLSESNEKYRTVFDLMDQGFCICEMLIDENGTPYDYRFLEVNAIFDQHTGLKDATGKTALELVPNLEPHWIELYGKVALTGEPHRFTQGSTVMGRWFEVYAFRFGQPENHKFAILFTDISERTLAEERRRLLQTVAVALSQAMTQEEVTKIALEQGIAGLGATGGTIAILSQDQSQIQIIGSLGYPQQVTDQWAQFPLDHPTASIVLAMRERKPVWIRSPEDRAQILPLIPDLAQEEQHQAWAVLPFRVNEDLTGAIGLGFDHPRDFDDVERAFLITLTDYYAQALWRTMLTQRMAQLATTEERQRLSRDLHDSVKQLLFASTTMAESLPRLWKSDPAKAENYTQDVITLNRAALAEMQILLYEMRPESITKTPFKSLLENLSRVQSGRSEIQINFNYEGPPELYLPAEAHITLYRLAQEALNNVSKHSQATQLDIACHFEKDCLRLKIRDNGKGFDVTMTSRGMGLNTMKERAQAVNATLEIMSTLSEGTEVNVKWRLEESTYG